MHHFDEVPRAVRPAVQIALLGSAADLFAPWRPRRGSHARGQRGKDRIEMLDSALLPANHQAVAALKPPNASARPHIKIVNTLRLQRGSAANILMVVRVAAIDHYISGLKER